MMHRKYNLVHSHVSDNCKSVLFIQADYIIIRINWQPSKNAGK